MLQPTPTRKEPRKKTAHELYQTKKPRCWQLLKFQWEAKETFRRQVGWLYPDSCPRILTEIYSMIDISSFNPSERDFEAIKPKPIHIERSQKKRIRSFDRKTLRSPKSPSPYDSDSDIEASCQQQIILEAKPPDSDSEDEPDVENIRK